MTAACANLIVTISTRTPEGLPSRCPLCGAEARLEYAVTGDDAPCPECGYLLWKSEQLLSKLQESLAHTLSVDASSLNVETSLIDDLKADSLDVVEFLMEFEEAAGLQIPDSDY